MAERINQAPPEEEVGVKHVSLTPGISSRDGTLNKAPKMVNCYPEQTDTGVVAKKRPGMSLSRQNPAGRSFGQFLHLGFVHSIVAKIIYNLDTGAVLPFASSVLFGNFFSFLSDIPFGNSLIKTESALWKIDPQKNDSIVTDPAYPASTVRGIPYLDGFYFVLSTDGTIQHSASLNPMVWPALNFIGVDKSYGVPRVLSRHLNYITAFCSQGVQLFYNAGNATGSVLAPVGNANWRMGCAHSDSVLNINDDTYFVALDGAGSRSVQKLSGLSMTRVSDVYIEKILAGVDLSAVFFNDIRTDGHSFYTLTLVERNVTLVFDTLLGGWTSWTSEVNGVEQYFGGVFAVNRGQYSYMQSELSGQVWRPNISAYTDVTGQINVRVVTVCHDWGTLNRKYMPAVYLIADTVATSAMIRYSDTDYQSFSNWRAIDLNSKRKMALKMGSSIRRSWEVWHTGNSPFRAFTLQLDVARGAD